MSLVVITGLTEFDLFEKLRRLHTVDNRGLVTIILYEFCVSPSKEASVGLIKMNLLPICTSQL